ncbi:hypothetical protein BU16DRAFT_607047 [Lophium mytilinum]|uniref:Uncharacterized protein n=1 Tax=Lophium mytilinum TaxID=390894 RepID=A0A6A6R2R5_9PEZI|nr:hypothetical protein BU16DRAFT_607047 [Lophium mytilinum]
MTFRSIRNITTARTNTLSSAHSSGSLNFNASFGVSTKQLSSPSIASHGTGILYASSCDLLWRSYTSATFALYDLLFSATTLIDGFSYNTQPDVFIETLYTTLCSEMCPGVCVATSSMPTKTMTRTPDTVGPILTLATPNCKIRKADCDFLWQSYSCASAAYSHEVLPSFCNTFIATVPLPLTQPSNPACSKHLDPNSNPITKGQYCVINPGALVELIYWEITTNVSRNLCATTLTNPGKLKGAIPSSSATAPVTHIETANQPSVILSGTTFWANSAYIRYPLIWAEDGARHTLGPILTNAVVTLHSSDVSSYRNGNSPFVWSFNFADLVDPVPLITWQGQDRDWGSDGELYSTIIPGDYHPHLSMPTQVMTLKEEWQDCEFLIGYVNDPPVRVQSIGAGGGFSSAKSNVGYTTKSTPVATSTAEPVQSIGTPLPQNTRKDPVAVSTMSSGSYDPPASLGDPTTIPHAPVATVGTQTLVIDPENSGIIIGTHELTRAAAPTTIDGTPVSFGTSGLVTIGGSTLGVPQHTSLLADPIATIGTQTLFFDPTNSAVIIRSHTLSPGAPPTTIDGTPISLGPGGVVVVRGSTLIVPQLASQSADPITTIGTQPLFLDPTNSAVMVGSHTLIPGAPPITVDGTAVSLGTRGGLIVGISTISLPFAVEPSAMPLILDPSLTLMLHDPVLTTAGQTFSLGPSGLVILDPTGTRTIAISAVPGGAMQTVTDGNDVYILSAGSDGAVFGVQIIASVQTNSQPQPQPLSIPSATKIEDDDTTTEFPSSRPTGSAAAGTISGVAIGYYTG